MDISNHRAAGSRDPDFARDGVFTFTQDIYGMLAINGLVSGADGAITVALMQADVENVANRYGIGRLLMDGTPDPDFGVNGVITGQYSDGNPSFGGIPGVTHDGRLLISGYFGAFEGFAARTPAVARYLGTGELDVDFGKNGQVVFDFPPPKPVSSGIVAPEGGLPDTPYELFSFDITPLSDGKIVFSGVTEPERDQAQSRFSVLGRLNIDGSLDETFGAQGYIHLKGIRNIVDQHLVLPDGRILISGQMEDLSGHLGYVARYLPDGELDRDFGSAGYLFIRDLNGGHVTAMALYGDGGLLVGMNRPAGTGRGWHGRLQAFADNGQPDAGFNGGHPVDIVLGTSGFKLVLKDMVIDGDGVVLLGDMGNIALARYLLDGTADVSYGSDSGWSQYPGKESYDLARQPDGKILATGMSNTGEKIVARFLGT